MIILNSIPVSDFYTFKDEMIKAELEDVSYSYIQGLMNILWYISYGKRLVIHNRVNIAI